MSKEKCLFYNQELDCCTRLSDTEVRQPCLESICSYEKMKPIINKKNEYDVFTIFKEKENYKSPLEAKEIFPCDIVKEISEFVDNKIHAEIVHKYGIFVDKEELTKALKYDRNQYKQGWIDGYKTAMGETFEKREIRKPTNFEKITESVERLAEFIKLVSACQHMSCSKCPLDGINCSSAIGIKEWLQKECE